MAASPASMAIPKKQLEIILSRLAVFDTPDVNAEQYPTDSAVASEMLWQAFMQGDIDGRHVADLGCGTGILGIGALFLGAESVVFLDNDPDTLVVLRKNLETVQAPLDCYRILESDVAAFNDTVDIVLQNPPFGTKTEHADRIFLEKAMALSGTVYSFHKLSTHKFVEAMARDGGFDVKGVMRFNFPLKKTQSFHTRAIHRIEVGCWVLRKR